MNTLAKLRPFAPLPRAGWIMRALALALSIVEIEDAGISPEQWRALDVSYLMETYS